MKSPLPLLLALSLAVVAHAATPIEELLGPALTGKATAYFRIALEKRNGIDLREFSMPKPMIQSLEREGASVRPNRTDVNVGYWIFFKNGDFASCDVINEPASANLPYAKLVAYFADAPHDGPKWSREGDSLIIGRRYYSVRVLTANDPVSGGRKGELEVAVVDGAGAKLYYYFGKAVLP